MYSEDNVKVTLDSQAKLQVTAAPRLLVIFKFLMLVTGQAKELNFLILEVSKQ